MLIVSNKSCYGEFLGLVPGDMCKAFTCSASYFETCLGFCGFSFSPQISLHKNQFLHEKEVWSENRVGARNSLPTLWH